MATLATNVSFQCFGLDGKPLAGGKVYTYSAGTTTSKATYTTMAGTVANPNPVILDQNGKAKIFLGDGSYRLQIKDSNDALIDDIDQISRYVTQSEFATFQQTVNDGVSQLTEVREQIDVFVSTSIGNQKGFANGIVPLNANVKIDPIYIESMDVLPYLPLAYPKSTPPTGYLVLMGQSISQATYPILYSLYGATLPDMRSQFLRGLDYGKGIDEGRIVLSLQEDMLKSHNHVIPPSNVVTGVGMGFQGSGFQFINDKTTEYTGGTETRPKNIAFLYIVKAG